MRQLALAVTVVTGALLLYAATDFPEWGDPESPGSASPVSMHFVAETGVDTEVPNMVTAVLADYRGFDTFGELMVIFTAGVGCLLILGGTGEDDDGPETPPEEDA